MTNGKSLREHLVSLLKSDSAHVDFEAAIKDLAPSLRGQRPKGAAHSPWEVLEHLRITQSDILEFTRDSKHVSPDFPAGYWPATPEPPNEKAWDQSAAAFRKDLAALIELVGNESVDLFAEIPGSEGKTPLREVLLVADHNAYHVGELIVVRRLLGAWQ